MFACSSLLVRYHHAASTGEVHLTISRARLAEEVGELHVLFWRLLVRIITTTFLLVPHVVREIG